MTGIVVVRPGVQTVRLAGPDRTIDQYRRGLLCQAKMFRRNSQWGGLTPRQRQVLPNKLNYLALLLYRYIDQNAERRILRPFDWQLAREATIEQIQSWLADASRICRARGK